MLSSILRWSALTHLNNPWLFYVHLLLCTTTPVTTCGAIILPIIGIKFIIINGGEYRVRTCARFYV